MQDSLHAPPLSLLERHQEQSHEQQNEFNSASCCSTGLEVGIKMSYLEL